MTNSQKQPDDQSTPLDAITRYGYSSISIIGFPVWSIIALLTGITFSLLAFVLRVKEQNIEAGSNNHNGSFSPMDSSNLISKFGLFYIKTLLQIIWKLVQILLRIPLTIQMRQALQWAIDSIPAHIKPNKRTFIFGCGFLAFIFVMSVTNLLTMTGIIHPSSTQSIPIDYD